MLKANMEQNRLMNREMLNQFNNGLGNVKYQVRAIFLKIALFYVEKMI